MVFVSPLPTARPWKDRMTLLLVNDAARSYIAYRDVGNTISAVCIIFLSLCVCVCVCVCVFARQLNGKSCQSHRDCITRDPVFWDPSETKDDTGLSEEITIISRYGFWKKTMGQNPSSWPRIVKGD